MSGFIRCEWCGNTYADRREYCPHCLAPRPTVDDSNVAKFYADGELYLTWDGGQYLTLNEQRDLAYGQREAS